MKRIFLLLLIALAITACQKKLEVDFSTDKEEYNAGEVIHCTNNSKNTNSYLWGITDGGYYESKDFNFTTDSNANMSHVGIETITLQVFNSDGNKSETVSKSVKINQGIFYTDYFSVDSFSFYKVNAGKTSFYDDSLLWNEQARCDNSSNATKSGAINIKFANRPIGSALFWSTFSKPQMGEALITINTNDAKGKSVAYNSIVGNVDVDITSRGKVRCIFKHIKAIRTDLPTDTVLISGDITCY
jgi:hypothetical protein